MAKLTDQKMIEELEVLKQVCIEDYNRFMDNERMQEEYAEKWDFKAGKKYIKIVKDGSVWGFIVNVHDDAKFEYGDILKAASWNAPARNQSRGNIFGDYQVQWTGPLYL